MSETTFDLNILQSRINQIKEEDSENNDFIEQYITCLIKRHDLKEALPDDFVIEEIPESMMKGLAEGLIPSMEDIALLSDEVKGFLLSQLLWVCGMWSIAAYGENEEIEDGDEPTFDAIITMAGISEAHYVGSYLVCALTLLLGQIPTFELIEALTDNFNEHPAIIERSKVLLFQLISGVVSRYDEDVMYYLENDEW